MAFNQEKHNNLRKWAADNNAQDPEELILRTETGVQFKGPSSLKSYKRLEKMYCEALEAENCAKA